MEGKPLLQPHALQPQTLAQLTEMCSHSVMPAVIPGNSSKCALKSQQLFQITAMKKALAAALPQLGMKPPSWQLPNTDCHQNSSPRKGSLHVRVPPPAHTCSEAKAGRLKTADLMVPQDPRSPLALWMNSQFPLRFSVSERCPRSQTKKAPRSGLDSDPMMYSAVCAPCYAIPRTLKATPLA